MNLAALEIKTIGNEVTVLFCGVMLAQFNEVSNDYAHTCASDFKKLFTEAWFEEGNDRLSMEKRVDKCKQQAYSKLST